MPATDYGQCVTDATSVQGLPELLRERADWTTVLAAGLRRRPGVRLATATAAQALRDGALPELVAGTGPAALKRDRALARLVAEVWGEQPLALIDTPDVEALEDELSLLPRPRTGKPIAVETTRRAVAMAVDLVNAWRAVHGRDLLPPYVSTVPAVRQERPIPLLVEARDVLNAMDDPRHQLVLVFIVACGLRESEVPCDPKTLSYYLIENLLRFTLDASGLDFTPESGRPQASIMPDWARKAVRNLLHECGDDPPPNGPWPKLRSPLATACRRAGVMDHRPADFRRTWQAVARQFGLPRRLVRHGIRPDDVLIYRPEEGEEPPELRLAMRWTEIRGIEKELPRVLSVPRAAAKVGHDEPERRSTPRRPSTVRF